MLGFGNMSGQETYNILITYKASSLVNENVLIFFSLSSVDDKHNVRDSDTCLSDVGRQYNLKKRQSRADHLMYKESLKYKEISDTAVL